MKAVSARVSTLLGIGVLVAGQPGGGGGGGGGGGSPTVEDITCATNGTSADYFEYFR